MYKKSNRKLAFCKNKCKMFMILIGKFNIIIELFKKKMSLNLYKYIKRNYKKKMILYQKLIKNKIQQLKGLKMNV